jgi:aspartate ammonia-lyase
MEPVIAYCILESQTMLMNAAETLREHCVRGITANNDVCRRYVEHSIGVVTALNPLLGYAIASELAAEALKTGKGIVALGAREKVAVGGADRQCA